MKPTNSHAVTYLFDEIKNPDGDELCFYGGGVYQSYTDRDGGCRKCEEQRWVKYE